MEKIPHDELQKAALANPQETVEQIMLRLGLDISDEKTVTRVYGILEQTAPSRMALRTIAPLKINPELLELIHKAKAAVDKMTPEELCDMIRKQGEGWAKSEAQWAKDFREGKCERD